MSHDDRTRLDDIAEACAAIRTHLARGNLADGLVFDAVCMRMVQIGEAAKTIAPELLAREPGIPWRQVIAMRGSARLDDAFGPSIAPDSHGAERSPYERNPYRRAGRLRALLMLTAQEREQRAPWARRRSSSQALASRSPIVLGSAGGSWRRRWRT